MNKYLSILSIIVLMIVLVENNEQLPSFADGSSYPEVMFENYDGKNNHEKIISLLNNEKTLTQISKERDIRDNNFHEYES